MVQLPIADPMQALGFDETDLRANREGHITTRQKRHILSLFGLKLVAVIVGFLAVIGATVNLLPRLTLIRTWALGDWVLLVFAVLFGAGSVYATWGVIFDVVVGKCRSISGTASVAYHLEPSLGMVATISVTDGLTGQPREFEVLSHALQITPGGLLTVYFAPRTGELIGLEERGDTSNA